MASSYTSLLYHIVYSTKYRRNLIAPELREDLYAYIGGIIRNQDGVQLEIGGMPDHVHILARLSPKFAIADVLRVIKANSAKWANERPGNHPRFAWQTGYSAFSVSRSREDAVRTYIQSQEEHHRRKTFKEEYLEMLQRHGIEFELRYVFEEEHVS